METVVQFLFRGQLYSCCFLIDTMEEPSFIFCFLQDVELIKVYGDEVSIKTDGRQMLPRRADYPALIELRQAIFCAIQNTKEFLQLTGA